MILEGRNYKNKCQGRVYVYEKMLFPKFRSFQKTRFVNKMCIFKVINANVDFE